MSPAEIILVLCAAAFVAWLINLHVKLPKYVFAFFVVAIVVSLCWFALGGNGDGNAATEEKSATQRDVEARAARHVPAVFIEAARDVTIPLGETRFKLPIFVSGKRRYDCVRFVIGAADDASLTEQALVSKMRFTLVFADGTRVPEKGISFDSCADGAFPKKFVLKIYFAPPEQVASNVSDVLCVVENDTGTIFRVDEISVAARPEETAGNAGVPANSETAAP